MRGLIGKKLGHSFSKEIHEQFYKEYALMEVSDLDAFMQQKAFDAINVTIPYKEAVLPYLDCQSEEVSKIGACNTIVKQDGKLVGYNTDYYGFMYMLKKHKVNLEGKKIVILGYGGASKAVIAVLKDLKISNYLICKPTKTQNTITYQELYANHRDSSVIINTSYVGMYPNNDDRVIDLTYFKELDCVIDLIYNPLKTNLIVDAQKRKIKAIGGLEMLVAQAIKSISLFLNQAFHETLIDEIYQSLLKKKYNLVLIGPSYSGKTTIGAYLAEMLDYKLIDIDAEIEKEIKMNISMFFTLHGEKAFRILEEKIIKTYAKMHHNIIITGAGAVINPRNMQRLLQNGYIYSIDRPMEHIVLDSTRPLATNMQQLKQLNVTRKALYDKYCDEKIMNHTTIQACAEVIAKKWRSHEG